MNRLVADALIERARQGQRVMVLSHTHQAARQAYTEVVDRPIGGSIQQRSSNGSMWVAIGGSGGRIEFRSVQGHGYRGFSADLVYVEREADEGLAQSMYMDVRAMVAVTGGEIVRE